jgi:hypothetical protein
MKWALGQGRHRVAKLKTGLDGASIVARSGKNGNSGCTVSHSGAQGGHPD